MVDTVNSLTARLHDLLVTCVGGAPQRGDLTAGLHDVVARAAPLGPDGAWLAAAGHANLGDLAFAQGDVNRALYHLDAAVTAGYNDCVALHIPSIRPLHQDPRFRFTYGRMRITQGDFDELLWLHREMQITVGEAREATVDNIGRLDTGVSSLPQAPLPTRAPHTPGLLITRVELAALQTALQQAALKAEFGRSAGNTSLDLIDGTWDLTRARSDAWHADDRDTRRQQEAEARAFVERPGAGAVLLACPPLGSITYPG
ncbi:hypothetical protein ACIRBY_05060 [Streptomyces sp. NPDC096136]|uniref:hypothetical protein n=1 Tax=Streptomyces sp. NPDC096136 TaxID=3366076 RepID=UPI00381C639E